MAFYDKLAKAGWVPHPGQRAYLESLARFRVLACGRRWGKTDAAAADIALRIISRRTSRQLAVAPTLAQARIVFDRVQWMLLALGVAFTPVSTPHPTIRVHEGGTKKGAVVHVLDARSGHEAKNLRGRGADHVLIDEAAFVPESLITEVAMPMLAANNGRMTLISTPRGRNFFYRLFKMGERGENGFWSRTSPSSENPLVSQEYLALQREILTDRAYRTEYEAEFLDSSNAVFQADVLDAALMATPAEDGPIVLGIDWARYQDYTGVVAVRGSHRRAEVVHCEQWTRLRWKDQVAMVKQLVKNLGVKRVVCDVTGAGDPVTEQLREVIPQIPVDGFVFTRQSKTELIERLSWMLERGVLRLLPDPALLRELEHFEGTEDEHGIKYAATAGFTDDCVCALAMACHVLPRALSIGVVMRERRRT